MFRSLASSIAVTLIGLACLPVAPIARAGISQQWECTNTDSEIGGIKITYSVCGWVVTSTGGGGSPSPGAGSGGVGPGGGGSVHSGNNAQTQPTASNSHDKNPCTDHVGDPIEAGTGDKTIAVTDFSMPGEMGLSFSRYYISRNVHGSIYGGWADNLDYELHSTCMSSIAGSCNTATFMRPDGSEISFSQSFTSQNTESLTGPFTEIGGGGLATLTYNNPDDGEQGIYQLVDEDGMVYKFVANKGLSSIKDVSGIGWTIAHSPDGVTTTVTHTSGQQMILTTSLTNGIAGLTVKDPAGNTYNYQSIANNNVSLDLIPLVLGTVTLPGSTPTSISYKYQSINASNPAILGLSEVDYNGVAYELDGYDSNGNANMVSAGDGTHKTSIVYAPGATIASATITNELGHVSVYQYNSLAELLSITENQSAHCAAEFASTTYDANQNIQSATDNNGNVTNYTYASNGLLQQKVEAAGTSLARTTTYQWDSTPGTSRPLSVTIAGVSKTTYTYDTNNRLASVAITNLSSNGTANQTLTTTYQYALYSNGMVQTMSVTHPSASNSNIDVYSYDALGNLTSMRNALGQTTTYSNYNANGLVGHVVGPNGDATDYTYDGRGLMLTKTTYPNGVAATLTKTYDGFGLVATSTSPDGEVTTYTRDAHMQVTQVTRNDKDGASTETIGHDAMGNVTSDIIVRGSITGISSTASYDELGRLFQKLGSNGQVSTYSYDGNGNIQSITDAMGHVKSYQYDQLNRVSLITESGGATPLPVTAAPVVTAPSTNATGAYTVSWTPAINATTYTLREQINGGAWTNVQTGSAVTWGASGQQSGTYAYQAQGCNTLGCGPWSTAATVAVTRPPSGAPALSAPANNNNGAYSVSWSAVSAATSYTLQQQANGGAWSTIQSSAATSKSITGEGNGTYGYRAQACNAGGCGPWSATDSVVVTFPPSSAPTITVPATSNTGYVYLSWTSIAGATSYTLQQQFDSGAWTTLQSNASVGWGNVAPPYANGSYGYQVQACNIGGCGPWSAVSTVHILVPVKPPACKIPPCPQVVAYGADGTTTDGSTEGQP